LAKGKSLKASFAFPFLNQLTRLVSSALFKRLKEIEVQCEQVVAELKNSKRHTIAAANKIGKVNNRYSNESRVTPELLLYLGKEKIHNNLK